MLEEIKTLLKKLIRNKCVNPPGGERRNIETDNRFLESYGIETEVFETAPERGNLLAEISGEGNGTSLMFGPSHVDVVPVSDEGNWTIPPFEGVEKDGFIWGRGAIDMLYLVACQSVAFAHLHKEGFRPKGTLKLLIVSDEESSGEFGAKWIIEKHPEKVKVDYLLTETGGEPIAENGMAFWYGEKGPAFTRLRIKGIEQHGSIPFASDNAVVKMAEITKRIVAYQPPHDTTFIKPFLELVGMGRLPRSLVGNRRTFPLMLKLTSKQNMSSAKFLHALTQMTWSPNIVKGGTKVNVVAGEAYLDIDVRILPGQDEEYFRHHLKQALGSLCEETVIERLPSEEGGGLSLGSSSMHNSPLFSVMQEVVHNIKGSETTLIPLMSTGATDARFFRKTFGTQAYGFAVFDDLLDLDTI